MVFDGADIRVTRSEGATPFTMAFFTHHFSRPNICREWGRKFAERHGIDALFFSASSNHWWNTPEFAPAVAAARAATGQRIVGYGVSMGGTGALLAFTDVMAFVPQASVDPAVVPWEPRWLSDRAALAYRRLPARARGRSMIVLDPTVKLDARHADMIGGRRMEFPGRGHTLARALAAEGSLAKLVLDFAEGRPN